MGGQGAAETLTLDRENIAALHDDDRGMKVAAEAGENEDEDEDEVFFGTVTPKESFARERLQRLLLDAPNAQRPCGAENRNGPPNGTRPPALLGLEAEEQRARLLKVRAERLRLEQRLSARAPRQAPAAAAATAVPIVPRAKTATCDGASTVGGGIRRLPHAGIPMMRSKAVGPRPPSDGRGPRRLALSMLLPMQQSLQQRLSEAHKTEKLPPVQTSSSAPWATPEAVSTDAGPSSAQCCAVQASSSPSTAASSTEPLQPPLQAARTRPSQNAPATGTPSGGTGTLQPAPAPAATASTREITYRQELQLYRETSANTQRNCQHRVAFLPFDPAIAALAASMPVSERAPTRVRWAEQLMHEGTPPRPAQWHADAVPTAVILQTSTRVFPFSSDRPSPVAVRPLALRSRPAQPASPAKLTRIAPLARPFAATAAASSGPQALRVAVRRKPGAAQ